MQRRSFIKHTLAAGTVFSLVPAIAFESQAPISQVMAKDQIRHGLFQLPQAKELIKHDFFAELHVFQNPIVSGVDSAEDIKLLSIKNKDQLLQLHISKEKIQYLEDGEMRSVNMNETFNEKLQFTNTTQRINTNSLVYIIEGNVQIGSQTLSENHIFNANSNVEVQPASNAKYLLIHQSR